MTAAATRTSTVFEVGSADLPLHCPSRQTALWSAHPRVFLDFDASGEVMCPYCGAHYRLKSGVVVHPHHS